MIIYLNYIQSYENRKEICLKNSDIFNINLTRKSYTNISRYLNNKFDTSIRDFSRIFSFDQKVIKIKPTGLFNKSNHLNWLKNKLDDKFKIEYDDPNPDYLIYNIFNDDDKDPKYKDAIRIAIYTENIMPDLNYADYIIGHFLEYSYSYLIENMKELYLNIKGMIQLDA